MENRKKCPYCGEDIAASAKKCRYCGEWLEAEETVMVPETVETINQNYAERQDDLTVADGLNGQVPATVYVNGVPSPVQPQPIIQSQMQTPLNSQQPVINIQLAQETVVNNQVNQEVNQTVATTESKSSGSGFLWFQLLVVGAAVWWGTGEWWAGLATWIILGIATQIPVIGGLLCFALGAGVGLFAGGICAGFGAPTWLCWLVGIIVGIGAISMNFEDKDADD